MKLSLASSFSVLLAGLVIGAEPSQEGALPQAGTRVDLAQFGTSLNNGAWAGVEWDNPREAYEVEVAPMTQGTRLPDSLHVEWWGSVWPGNGVGGWMKLDDHWNGRWVRAEAMPERDDKTAAVRFRMTPLTLKEWPKALKDDQYEGKKPPQFRRTHKIRVIGKKTEELPQVQVRVYSSAVWREGAFNIELLSTQAASLAGRVEVADGYLQSLISLAASLPDSKNEASQWSSKRLPGQSVREQIRLLYVQNEDRNSNDLTRVTVRLGDAAESPGFSFVPQDVLAAGAMRIPSLGALVTPAGSHLTMANDPGPSDKFWRRTVRQRVDEMPEISREQAMANIPRLQPARWAPLGVPCARQEVVISPYGDWRFDPQSLWTESRDSQRSKLRAKEQLDAVFDTRSEPTFKEPKGENFKRYLDEGYLPLIHVEWDQGGVHYHHQFAATILLGDIGEDEKRRGDEIVTLLTRLEITNPGSAAAPARLALRFSDPTPIALQEDGVIHLKPADASAVPRDLRALRGVISMNKPAGGGAPGWTLQKGKDPKRSDVLSWSAQVAPGASQVIYFKATYVDLLEPTELDAVKNMDFDERVPHDLKYWKARLARDAQLDVPEPELMNFYRANLWHNVITCDRDPKTGLYNEGVGTFAYKVFANETVMIARSMDMRGEHKDAERYLEPLLHFQGNEELTGRYTTKEGVFHGAGAYTHGQYAMNHGFSMWGIADHYLYTRDHKYLERVAPQLIKGCDFVITQRKATTTAPSYDAGETGPASATYGLGPASSLEDVIEFKYWFPTNTYFYLGMKRVAEALADLHHPDAERIAREAEAYRQDIERAVRQAATRSAVVPLRNGTYAPFVPSRVHQWRALTEGWIREALYCGVDLTVGEVIVPGDPLVTWVLDQLEDNVFYSAESGYNIKDIDKNWFGQGAVTLQPCLVDLPRLYMNRDENPASLRAFWNAYALLIYPDVQCFAEWAHYFGRGGGPVYKTSDEARFCIWFRQFLVNEDGDKLWLARGTPRAWLADGKKIQVERAPTWFGDVSYSIASDVSHGVIRATVTRPSRNAPRELWLRLRHPGGLRPQTVLINGKPASPGQLSGEDIHLMGDTPQIEVVAQYTQ